jgi:tetratricopeptide (TPR) repeat protein
MYLKRERVPQLGILQRGILAGLLCAVCLFGAQPQTASASANPTPILPTRFGSDLVRDSEYMALSRASAKVSMGAYSQALPLLVQTTEQNPLNLLGLFHLGNVYLEMAKQTSDPKDRAQFLVESRQIFERVIDVNDEFILPYFKLGKIALMQNDIPAAKQYYQQGLAMDPQNATLVFNLARVCDQNGDRADAIRLYRQALSMDANFTFAYNNLALLYEDEKRYGEAEKAYKAALARDDKYNLARLNLGNLYATIGQYAAAQKVFAQARAQEPENTWVYYYEGNLYMRLGQYAQAIQAYNCSIELDASNATAYYLLAVSLSRLKRMDEAMQAGLHYMRLEPEGRYAREMQSMIMALHLSQSGSIHFTPANLSQPKP